MFDNRSYKRAHLIQIVFDSHLFLELKVVHLVDLNVAILNEIVRWSLVHRSLDETSIIKEFRHVNAIAFDAVEIMYFSWGNWSSNNFSILIHWSVFTVELFLIP